MKFISIPYRKCVKKYVILIHLIYASYTNRILYEINKTQYVVSNDHTYKNITSS